MADNTQQIIEDSLAKAGLQPPEIEKMMQGLALALKTSPAKLVHLGNTVFMVTPTVPGQVEVHTFSAETPQGLVENFKKLVAYLRNIGVKKASTFSDDGRFRKIAEMTGLPVKINQTTKMIGKEMKPVYEYVMEM